MSGKPYDAHGPAGGLRRRRAAGVKPIIGMDACREPAGQMHNLFRSLRPSGDGAFTHMALLGETSASWMHPRTLGHEFGFRASTSDNAARDVAR